MPKQINFQEGDEVLIDLEGYKRWLTFYLPESAAIQHKLCRSFGVVTRIAMNNIIVYFENGYSAPIPKELVSLAKVIK